MIEKFEISTPNAPSAIGPYSQAIVCDGWLYCSGQVAIDPATGEMIEGDVVAQARQVFANMKEVLKAAKSAFSQVVKVTVFLKDLEDFSAVNEVYAEFFNEPYPARACVEVSRLPKDALIELDCIVRVLNPYD